MQPALRLQTSHQPSHCHTSTSQSQQQLLSPRRLAPPSRALIVLLLLLLHSLLPLYLIATSVD